MTRQAQTPSANRFFLRRAERVSPGYGSLPFGALRVSVVGAALVCTTLVACVNKPQPLSPPSEPETPMATADASAPPAAKNQSDLGDDRDEQHGGLHEHEPEWAPGRDPSVLRVGNIVFEPGKISVEEGSPTERVLMRLKNDLEQRPNILLLRIEGYSDDRGKAEDNLEMSGKRALAIKAWLVAHGIDESRLIAVGFGSANPVGDNDTRAGRAQNRRTEFTVVKVEGQDLPPDPLGGGTEFK